MHKVKKFTVFLCNGNNVLLYRDDRHQHLLVCSTLLVFEKCVAKQFRMDQMQQSQRDPTIGPLIKALNFQLLKGVADPTFSK